jgi:hypothetical protein
MEISQQSTVEWLFFHCTDPCGFFQETQILLLWDVYLHTFLPSVFQKFLFLELLSTSLIFLQVSYLLFLLFVVYSRIFLQLYLLTTSFTFLLSYFESPRFLSYLCFTGMLVLFSRCYNFSFKILTIDFKSFLLFLELFGIIVL